MTLCFLKSRRRLATLFWRTSREQLKRWNSFLKVSLCFCSLIENLVYRTKWTLIFGQLLKWLGGRFLSFKLFIIWAFFFTKNESRFGLEYCISISALSKVTLWLTVLLSGFYHWYVHKWLTIHVWKRLFLVVIVCRFSNKCWCWFKIL